jgi:hypothetical protein
MRYVSTAGYVRFQHKRPDDDRDLLLLSISDRVRSCGTYDPARLQCSFKFFTALATLLRALILRFEELLQNSMVWLYIRVSLDLFSHPGVRQCMEGKDKTSKRRRPQSSSQKPKGNKGHDKSDDRNDDRPGNSRRSEGKSGDTDGKHNHVWRSP